MTFKKLSFVQSGTRNDEILLIKNVSTKENVIPARAVAQKHARLVGGDLGNEVVVKRDGCTQAIVEPSCEKIMSRREMWDYS